MIINQTKDYFKEYIIKNILIMAKRILSPEEMKSQMFGKVNESAFFKQRTNEVDLPSLDTIGDTASAPAATTAPIAKPVSPVATTSLEKVKRLQDSVIEILNTQITNELSSSQIYRAMSCWLDDQGWNAAAKYFFKSADEE